MSVEDAGWMNVSSSLHATPWKVTAFGKKQFEEFMNAQIRLLDQSQERNKYWFERVRYQVNSVSEVALKMMAAGSPPDAMKTYQEWISRQFELMAEDGKRILEDTQKLMMNRIYLLPNGRVFGLPHVST